MSRYHINPESGVASKCFAVKGRCPFGNDDAHYPSHAEATAAFESSMQANVLASHKRLKPSDANPTLSEVVPLDVLIKDIEDGFITARPHYDDPTLQILCYTKETQFAGHWTEATKVARGLVIRSEAYDFSDAVVVERPWRKFFTLEQLKEGDWVLSDEEREGESVEAELAQIDFEAPVEVTDKADGSLGILYRAPDGLPALATKGSFASDQANYYTKMLRNDERLLADAKRLIEDHGDQTHLFEMVGPKNRIVVQYDEDQIMLLGSVDKKTGRYISSNDHAAHWSGGAVEMMEARTIDEAFALADRPNREGVVIRILSEDPRKQMQLKVKQEDYKRIHRIISHFSLKDARAALRESTANADDLIRAARTGNIEAIPGVTNLVTTEFENHPIVDEMLAKRRELLEEKLMPRLKVYGEAFERVSALPDSAFTSRDAQKEFAASIQHEDPTMRSDLFSFYRARYDGVSMKEHSVHHILRNLSQLI